MMRKALLHRILSLKNSVLPFHMLKYHIRKRDETMYKKNVNHKTYKIRIKQSRRKIQCFVKKKWDAKLKTEKEKKN